MFHRILILQTGFLGDVVLGTTLIQAARRRWPGAYLAIMVRPAAAPLLEGLPFLDAVLTDTRHEERRGAAWLRSLRLLRRERFDLVLTAGRSFQTGLLLRAAGIPRRVGYRLGLNRCFFTDLVERPTGLHVSRRDLSLLAPLGGVPEAEQPAVARAAELPPSIARALEGERPLVALAPGSVWPTKRWPADRFAAVARELLERGQGVVLVGGPEDREVGGQIARAGSGVLNLCGAASLPETAAILSRCALLITNDSAPAHLAGAVGTPVVQIYGPTTPALGFAPLDPRSRTVEVELDCRPCARLHAPACPEGHFRCMRGITPEAVAGAAFQVLQAAPAA